MYGVHSIQWLASLAALAFIRFPNNGHFCIEVAKIAFQKEDSMHSPKYLPSKLKSPTNPCIKLLYKYVGLKQHPFE